MTAYTRVQRRALARDGKASQASNPFQVGQFVAAMRPLKDAPLWGAGSIHKVKALHGAEHIDVGDCVRLVLHFRAATVGEIHHATTSDHPAFTPLADLRKVRTGDVVTFAPWMRLDNPATLYLILMRLADGSFVGAPGEVFAGQVVDITKGSLYRA